MSLREYLHSVARCPTLEELWDLHTTKMATYGFDRLLYGFTRYRTSNSLGDPSAREFTLMTPECISRKS